MGFGITKLLTAGTPGGNVIAFLWKHKTTIVLCGAVLALMLYIMNIKDDAAEWKTKATALEGQVTTLQTNLKNEKDNHANNVNNLNGTITNLTNSINSQNTQIDNLNKLLSSKNKELEDLKKGFKEEQEKRRKEFEAMLKEQTPKTCNTAIDYLYQGKGDLKW